MNYPITRVDLSAKNILLKLSTSYRVNSIGESSRSSTCNIQINSKYFAEFLVRKSARPASRFSDAIKRALTILHAKLLAWLPVTSLLIDRHQVITLKICLTLKSETTVKNCEKCFASNLDDARFCASCGVTMTQSTMKPTAFAVPPPPMAVPKTPVGHAATSETLIQSGGDSVLAQPVTAIGFSNAIKICFTKYATFSGRATRPEFWWFCLFAALVTNLVGAVIGDSAALVCNLVFLLPSIAVGSRRLHDVGRSGWWQLIALTVIGLLLLLYWFVSKGKNEGNKYDSAAV